jgi:phage-related protein
VAFDAGTVEARLVIDPVQFDRDLGKAQADVKKFEDTPHRVKISAVFDTSSLTKARKAFSDLDNAISKDAMNRLRSSPQGSVLGALNALFSPHPVTGAPSPSQAASQGLLGKMITSPGGGGGAPNTALDNRTSGIGQVLTQAGRAVTTTDTITRKVTGAEPGNITTTDTIKEKLDPESAAQVEKDSAASGDRAGTSFAGMFRQRLAGLFSKDTADKTAAAATASGDSSGKGWSSAFSKHVTNTLSSLFGKGDTNSKLLKALDVAGGGTGSLKGGLASNLLGAAAPGISGVSGKVAGITALGGSALGAIPALLGGVAPLLPAAVGAGALGLLFKSAQSQISPVSQAISQAKAAQAAATTPAAATAANQQLAGANQQLAQLDPALQSIYKSEQQISNWWQDFSGKFAPMFAGPLKQVATLLTGLTGPLTVFFKSAFTLAQPLIAAIGDLARQWLPLLAQGFRAAAPVIRPLIDGIGALVTGLLPGLNTLVKASAPAVAALAHVFGELGGSLGQMLAIFAPVLSQSAVILKDLFDVVSALFPVIGQLAAIFASGLAPVFDQFSKIVQALLPFLVQVGKIIASFAGAALGDIVSLFGALATVLQAIGPSLAVFAKAIGNVFTVLENSSVFEILANAIENMAKPLGQLITALINGLVPILPPLINFIGQFAALLATQLSGAIVQLLPPLIQFATTALGAIARVLPAVLPLVAKFLTAFTADAAKIIVAIAKPLAELAEKILVKLLIAAAPLVPVIIGLLNAFIPLINVLTPVFVRVVSDLATALTAIVSAIPPGVLQAVAVAIGLIVAGVKAWAVAQAILDIDLTANPIGLLVVAIGLLVVAIVELVSHWSTVWKAIKDAAVTAWQAVYNNVIAPLINFFTQTIPHAFDVAIAAIKSTLGTWAPILATLLLGPIAGAVVLIATHWNTIKSTFLAAWQWITVNVLDPIGTFFTKTLPTWFDTAVAFVDSHFVTPFENALKGAWDWVVTNVATPLETLFTKTLPGWFDTAVSAISGFWSRLETVVEAPVKFVVDNVLDPLINVFDDVTNAVGLGKPIPVISLARGGKLPGFGGGDIQPALLEPGETVIDKDRTKQYAWLFKLLGVPGFATGSNGPVLGSRGGGGAKAPTSGTFGSTLGGIISGIGDLGKAVLAIATGNPTALANAVLGMFGGASSGGMGGTVGKALLGMPATLTADFAKWVIGQPNTAASQAGGGSPLHPTGSGATVQALMQSMAASVGWTGAEWAALNNVEIAEAGYNLAAVNPSSGAYGLAQFIQGASEYASYGGNSSTAAGQITGMLNYIKQRYGDPEAAWAHEQSFHWYGKGGPINEPVVGYGVNTGRGYVMGESGPEWVVPQSQMRGDSQEAILARLDALILATRQIPAGVGDRVGGAIGGSAQAAAFRNRYPQGGW